MRKYPLIQLTDEKISLHSADRGENIPSFSRAIIFRFATVCHGDLWTGNLMYKDDNTCAPKEYHCAAYLRFDNSCAPKEYHCAAYLK